MKQVTRGTASVGSATLMASLAAACWPVASSSDSDEATTSDSGAEIADVVLSFRTLAAGPLVDDDTYMLQWYNECLAQVADSADCWRSPTARIALDKATAEATIAAELTNSEGPALDVSAIDYSTESVVLVWTWYAGACPGVETPIEVTAIRAHGDGSVGVSATMASSGAGLTCRPYAIVAVPAGAYTGVTIDAFTIDK